MVDQEQEAPIVKTRAWYLAKIEEYEGLGPRWLWKVTGLKRELASLPPEPAP